MLCTPGSSFLTTDPEADAGGDSRFSDIFYHYSPWKSLVLYEFVTALEVVVWERLAYLHWEYNFHIPLHPDDAPKFSFSVPSTNMQVPLQQYHWVVSPQGMKNSSALCQWCVAKVFNPAPHQMPNVLLYHMEDIVVAAQQQEVVEKALGLVIKAVNQARLCIAPQKVQKHPPWRYLEWHIGIHSISPKL